MSPEQAKELWLNEIDRDLESAMQRAGQADIAEMKGSVPGSPFAEIDTSRALANTAAMITDILKDPLTYTGIGALESGPAGVIRNLPRYLKVGPPLVGATGGRAVLPHVQDLLRPGFTAAGEAISSVVPSSVKRAFQFEGAVPLALKARENVFRGERVVGAMEMHTFIDQFAEQFTPQEVYLGGMLMTSPRALDISAEAAAPFTSEVAREASAAHTKSLLGKAMGREPGATAALEKTARIAPAAERASEIDLRISQIRNELEQLQRQPRLDQPLAPENQRVLNLAQEKLTMMKELDNQIRRNHDALIPLERIPAAQRTPAQASQVVRLNEQLRELDSRLIALRPEFEEAKDLVSRIGQADVSLSSANLAELESAKLELAKLQQKQQAAGVLDARETQRYQDLGTRIHELEFPGAGGVVREGGVRRPGVDPTLGFPGGGGPVGLRLPGSDVPRRGSTTKRGITTPEYERELAARTQENAVLVAEREKLQPSLQREQSQIARGQQAVQTYRDGRNRLIEHLRVNGLLEGDAGKAMHELILRPPFGGEDLVSHLRQLTDRTFKAVAARKFQVAALSPEHGIVEVISDNLEQSVRVANQTPKAMKAEVAKLESEIAGLRRRLAPDKKTRLSINDTIDQLSAEIAGLKSQIEHGGMVLVSPSSGMSILSEAGTHARTDIHAAGLFQSVEARSGEVARRLRMARAETGAPKVSISEQKSQLEQEIGQLRGEVEGAGAQQALAERARLLATHTAKTEELKGVTIEWERLAQQHDPEARLAALRKEAESVQGQLARRKIEEGGLEAGTIADKKSSIAIRPLEEKLARLKQEMEQPLTRDIEHQIERLQGLPETPETALEIRELYGRLQQTETSGTEQQLIQITTRKRELENQIAQINKRSGELNTMYEGKLGNLQRLEARAQNLDQELGRLRGIMGQEGAFEATAGQGVYLMPRDLAHDFFETGDLLRGMMAGKPGDAFVGKAIDFVDGFKRYWATWATVANPGFHSRNVMTNYFQMWMAGMKPQDIVRLRLVAEKLRNGGTELAGKTEYTYDQVRMMAEQLGVHHSEGAFIHDINQLSAVQREAAKVDEQIRVLQHGAQSPDNAQKIAALQEEKTLLFWGPKNRTTMLNPLSPDNAYVQAMRDFGSHAEQNGRMSLFLSGLENGLTPTEAALLVKKYLFHYDELTAFERSILKRFLPFYTWARNNVPLQIENLLTQPGKMLAVMEPSRLEGKPEKASLPKFMQGPFSFPLPFKVRGMPTLGHFQLGPEDVMQGGAIEDYSSGRGFLPVEPLVRGTYALYQGAVRYFGGDTAPKKPSGEMGGDPGSRFQAGPDIVPLPREMTKAIWRALPSQLKSVTGIEEMHSRLTGQPVPTMDPRVRDFLFTIAPLFQIMNRVMPTVEKLQNPRYIGSLTSWLTGIRVDPIDVPWEKARASGRYNAALKKRIEDLNLTKEEWKRGMRSELHNDTTLSDTQKRAIQRVINQLPGGEQT